MRDRLIELLGEAEEKCGEYKTCKDCIGYGKGDLCGEYLRADHLLANGVIVPPCKVGDTVYYLTTIDTEKELNVIEIFCGTVIGVSFEKIGVWVAAKYENGLYYCHKSEDFGETVFLTKEEAEKELERRKK